MADRGVAPEHTPDYEALVDSVNGIVWEGDPRTLRFSFVSRQAERILGFPVKRWIEEPDFWVARLHPDDRERVVASCGRENAQGRDHALEYRMIAADGREVWLRDNVTVVIEGGEPVACRGVMVEVGDHAAEADALHSAHEQLRAVVVNAPVSLFTLDAEGVLTFCEGGAIRRSPFDPEPLLGRRIDEILPRSEEFEPIRRDMQRALAGESFTACHEIFGLVSETRFGSLRDERGRPAGVIGLGIDVTRRISAEREQEALRAQMLQVHKLESLGALAGGIAHDFNNLLMTILGSAGLVLSDLAPDARARADLERIRRAARSGSVLTERLLEYAGRRPLEVRRVDVSELVSEMRVLLEGTIWREARLVFEPGPERMIVEGESAGLHRALLNLVINASESLGEALGSITLRTSIRPPHPQELTKTHLLGSLVASQPYVVLEVLDTGCGMDADSRARIFDPFFSTKGAGRGLGLATVLGIVRAHRGAVSVYSEPGQGSLFRVFLPAAAELARRVEPPPVAEPQWVGEGTLLVVDDEAPVLEVTSEMVERMGFDTVVATSGAEALRLFDAEPDAIRAVLLDMTMPDLDGPQTARTLRAQRPDLPILFMSGYSEEHVADVLAEQVADGFLQKPFDYEALARALRELLDEA